MSAFLRPTSRRRRRGATLVLIAILMVVLIAMVAFSVDVARMYLVRAQLQSAVDSGALAATLQLQSDDQNVDAALQAARQFVRLNRVGWLITVPEDAITIEAGTWDASNHAFSTGGAEPNAVRVFARQDDEPLFFAGVLGFDKFAVPREAIAAMGERKMDIILTLDLSGSMASEGRIEALRQAAPVFVTTIEGFGGEDRIGVMGYGAIIGQYDPVARGHQGTVYEDAPSNLYPNNDDWAGVLEAGETFDFDFLRDHVLDHDTLIANKYNGWTPTGAAIRDSAHYLQANGRTDVAKVIVLMSDGHANRPEGNGPGYARDMAAYAKTLGIKVYTISLGNGADERLMEEIAQVTGAKHFPATGSGQTQLSVRLTQAFRSVAGAIKATQIVQ